MKHWVLVFSPDTYDVVKQKLVVGVRHHFRKSFSEKIQEGDRFITYISKKIMFDGFGSFRSEAYFDETPIFHEEKIFPFRRKIDFEVTDLKKRCGELFWGIEPFNRINTSPGNWLMCCGGFVEISAKDFNWLIKEIQK